MRYKIVMGWRWCAQDTMSWQAHRKGLLQGFVYKIKYEDRHLVSRLRPCFLTVALELFLADGADDLKSLHF